MSGWSMPVYPRGYSREGQDDMKCRDYVPRKNTTSKSGADPQNNRETDATAERKKFQKALVAGIGAKAANRYMRTKYGKRTSKRR